MNVFRLHKRPEILDFGQAHPQTDPHHSSNIRIAIIETISPGTLRFLLASVLGIDAPATSALPTVTYRRAF